MENRWGDLTVFCKYCDQPADIMTVSGPGGGGTRLLCKPCHYWRKWSTQRELPPTETAAAARERFGVKKPSDVPLDERRAFEKDIKRCHQ